MLTEKSKKEVGLFLKDNPNPRIVTASTIKSGYVSCIKPIKTICGPELMCSNSTRDSLVSFIYELKHKG